MAKLSAPTKAYRHLRPNRKQAKWHLRKHATNPEHVNYWGLGTFMSVCNIYLGGSADPEMKDSEADEKDIEDLDVENICQKCLGPLEY